MRMLAMRQTTGVPHDSVSKTIFCALRSEMKRISTYALSLAQFCNLLKFKRNKRKKRVCILS